MTYQTIWTYCSQLASFFEWINSQHEEFKELRELLPNIISEYCDITPSYYSSINSFFGFCGRNKLVFRNPCAGLTIARRRLPEEVLSFEEQQELFNYALNQPSLATSVLIMLTLVHGLTPKELLTLRVCNFDFEYKCLDINETRRVMLDPDTIDSLQNYLIWRKGLLDDRTDPGYLFLSNYAILQLKSVSYNFLNEMLKRINPGLSLGKLHDTHVFNLILETNCNVSLVSSWTGLTPNTVVRKAELWGNQL